MGRSLEPFQLTPAELEIVKRGMTDAVVGGRLQAEPEKYAPRLHDLLEARQAKLAEANKRAAVELLKHAAQQPGAETLPSGIVYWQTQAGTGTSPKSTDMVVVHYRGTLPDGTEFDSSYKRSEPSQFALSGVVPCWTQALQRMKVGGKARFLCPPETAYGEKGSPPMVPPNATLHFEVELLDVRQAASSPRQPRQRPELR